MIAESERLVRRFYTEVWEQADEAAARMILDADFAFRGSLGTERHGVDGFIQYLRAVHGALGEFRCVIGDLVATDCRAAARMNFTGVHRGDLFGVRATGRPISWAGAAFFTFARGRITALWVLGDVDGVKAQLGRDDTLPFQVPEDDCE